MKINNHPTVARTDLRKKAIDILSAGVDSALPENFMKEHVKFEGNKLIVCGDSYNLGNGKIYVIGGGKGAGLMAKSLEKIIPSDKIVEGIVNAQRKIDTSKIVVNEAGLPLPDKRGLIGVEKMMSIASRLKKEDIVLCLITGGGSALLPAPVDGVTLEDEKKMNEVLIKCGVDHYEINIVRKQVSKIKGGKLAKLLQPAKVISLILSDDFGGKDDVASGPTHYDSASFKDAYEILKKYDVLNKIPLNILKYIERGMRGEISGNVSSDDIVWKNVHNYTLADNKISLKAMKERAEKLGFEVAVIESFVAGDVDDIADTIASVIMKVNAAKKGKFAIIFGSENTVKVKGSGKGGRNQAFVASMIDKLAPRGKYAFASIDSDGMDFLPGVAGAIFDENTREEIINKELPIQKFISENNTYELHKILDNLILSEPTGTNVGDLNIYVQENI